MSTTKPLQLPDHVIIFILKSIIFRIAPMKLAGIYKLLTEQIEAAHVGSDQEQAALGAIMESEIVSAIALMSAEDKQLVASTINGLAYDHMKRFNERPRTPAEIRRDRAMHRPDVGVEKMELLHLEIAYNAYLTIQGLRNDLCCDELLFLEKDTLTDDQKVWLQDFSDTWEQLQRTQAAVAKLYDTIPEYGPSEREIVHQ